MRCCEYDTGSDAVRETGTIGGSGGCRWVRRCSDLIWSAMPATVGRSNSARKVNSTRNTSRIRDSICVAKSECPPKAKKSAWRSAESRPNTSAQISVKPCSIESRGRIGGLPSTGTFHSYRLSACRSTLPLTVTGNCSSTITATGTRYDGIVRVRNSSTC